MPAPDDALPPIGAPVTLVFDERRMRAQLTGTGADADAVELAVAGATPALRAAAADSAGMLEFVTDRGPCRMRGAIAIAARDDPESLHVRFTPAGPAQLLLRNDRVRARVEVDIEVDFGGQLRRTRTRDLRGGGALLHGPIETEVGAAVSFHLRLPERAQAIAGAAHVARIAEDGDVAIQFEDLTPEESASITLAVYEAQRGLD